MDAGPYHRHCDNQRLINFSLPSPSWLFKLPTLSNKRNASKAIRFMLPCTLGAIGVFKQDLGCERKARDIRGEGKEKIAVFFFTLTPQNPLENPNSACCAG